MKTRILRDASEKRGLKKDSFFEVPEEKFILFDHDFDSSVFFAMIKTDELKKWYRFANNERYISHHCGHDYDCCGCVSSEYYVSTILDDTVVIKRTVGFNY